MRSLPGYGSKLLRKNDPENVSLDTDFRWSDGEGRGERQSIKSPTREKQPDKAINVG